MGSRKHNSAELRSEARKSLYIARLRNVPTSPRKMRIVADMIRGMNVETAMSVLEHSPNEASGRLYKLLRSAIANWEVKNEGQRVEDNDLFVKEISVDSARILKRIQPAHQGRAHRIRKRSNHVTMILGNRVEKVEEVITENTEE